MEYELIRLTKGYILIELRDSKKVLLDNSTTLSDLRENDIKIVATTEIMDDLTMADYSMLRIEDCNDFFGISDKIEPKVDGRYLKAKPLSADHLKGLLDLVRQQMYNYLSGKTTHKEFVKVYRDYENILGEMGISDINGFRQYDENGELLPDDENDDDEYFNIDLEDEKFSRELPKTKTRMKVNVMSLHDEQNCVVMFQKLL